MDVANQNRVRRASRSVLTEPGAGKSAGKAVSSTASEPDTCFSTACAMRLTVSDKTRSDKVSTASLPALYDNQPITIAVTRTSAT